MGMFDDDPLKAPVVLPGEEPEPEAKPEPKPQTPAAAQPEPETDKQPEPNRYEHLMPVKQKRRRWPLILGGVLILAALAFAAWMILGPGQTSDTSTSASDAPAAEAETAAPATTAADDLSEAKLTETAENSFLGVTLSHPTGWTVTVPDDKTSIKVESPEFKYKTTDKGEVTGFFRLYIRKGAREVDGKYIGRGVAVQDSEKLTYTDPALGQRTDTFLTRYGYDTADNFAFFLIAGNFDLDKGQTLGPDYGKEPETYIVAGGYSDKSLTDDLAMNMVAPEYLKDSNAFKQAIEVVKSLKLQ